MRPKQVDTRDDEAHYYRHENETWLQMLKRVNWIAATVLCTTPLIALYGILFVPLQWKTALLTFIYYLLCGFGITAGYHRMWSHKAWKAVWPIRLLLMIFGTAAVQGSIRWWSRNHRIHHRYTDQPQDPYNARQGFLYSHFGWMLFTKDYSKIKKPRFDISDLESDPMVMWQNRNYPWLVVVMAWIVPNMIAGLGWGDWVGGFFYATVLRAVIVHHATFCVNSLAHWFGDQPYADDHTPRDHFLTALITLGEGYHNFHHEFPYDYRNAIKWYQYDPTKWLIKGLYYLGLAYDLKEFGDNEVQMGVWQMRQKKLDQEKARHLWPPRDEDLPTMDIWEFRGRCGNGEKLMIIDKYVVRVSDWISQHPGGDVITQWIGKDATEVFENGPHRHTPEAKGIAMMRRVAILERDEPVNSEKAK